MEFAHLYQNDFMNTPKKDFHLFFFTWDALQKLPVYAVSLGEYDANTGLSLN